MRHCIIFIEYRLLSSIKFKIETDGFACESINNTTRPSRRISILKLIDYTDFCKGFNLKYVIILGLVYFLYFQNAGATIKWATHLKPC